MNDAAIKTVAAEMFTKHCDTWTVTGIEHEGRKFIVKVTLEECGTPTHVLEVKPCRQDPLAQDSNDARMIRCATCYEQKCMQRQGLGSVAGEFIPHPDAKVPLTAGAGGRGDILDAVKRTICNDRQDVHGNPEDTHALIASFWNAYLASRDTSSDTHTYCTPQDVAVMMCLFKIARHAMNPKHADNLHDLIGYAAIAAELGAAK